MIVGFGKTSIGDADSGTSWSLLAAWGSASKETQVEMKEKARDGRPENSSSSRKSSLWKRIHQKSKTSDDKNEKNARHVNKSEGNRKSSPGAILRLQSATHPAPHPLPDLAKLTLPRHSEKMSTVIDSMASISRAGMENFVKKENQDALFAYKKFISDTSAIAGVLDGHGAHGHIISSFVKQRLPSLIAYEIERRGEAAAHVSIEKSFLDIQAALKSTKNINCRLSGSTAVITLLQGRRLITAWVGDSRAVLLRRQSPTELRSIELSRDHKPALSHEKSRILSHGGCVERLQDAIGQEVGPYRVWLPGAMVRFVFINCYTRSKSENEKTKTCSLLVISGTSFFPFSFVVLHHRCLDWQ